MRIGIAVIKPKKIHVFNPPPSFQVKYSGTPPRREKRSVLLKLSLPGPSAGRGAFFIAGYCVENKISAPEHQLVML
jgi:hypothetical protein